MTLNRLETQKMGVFMQGMVLVMPHCMSSHLRHISQFRARHGSNDIEYLHNLYLIRGLQASRIE